MNAKTEKWLKILAWLIVLVGAGTRLALYLQNRDLFIDEANVVRNIYERGFAGLVLPLSYEQYAPPVFLWLVKLCTLLFGYSEYAVRLYPLLTSIAALYVFMLVLKETTSYRSLWYPLGLMAVTFILIRYGSEIKQYSSDALVVLCVLLMALKINIQSIKPAQFIIWWFVAGSAAIWLSMPAVFMLAGVGCYYFWICLQHKDYEKLMPLFVTIGLWVLQFVFYYLAVLKVQANSNYLQSYHNDYFMYLLPKNKQEFVHNRHLLNDILQEASGHSPINRYLNIILMGVGFVVMCLKHRARAVLILVPIIAVSLAAGLHQYSLIPRVGIFMMPLFLLVIGYGLECGLNIKNKVWQVLLTLICIASIYDHSAIVVVRKQWKHEQVTGSLAFLKKNNITGQELYVHAGAVPVFIYYTTISPNKNEWAVLKDAHLLDGAASYDSVAQNVTGKSAFIYTSISGEELAAKKALLAKYFHEIARLEIAETREYAYIYSKP